MGRKILFITTDQQRYDSLGCNGGTIARTPVVDGLAARGVRLRARVQPEHGVHAGALDDAHRPVRAHARRDRERRAAARGRAVDRRVPARRGRLPHRAARQGALRARLRPPAPVAPRTTCRSRASTGPYRGFEHAELAMHVPAVGKRALQHYGRWLIDTHGIEATQGLLAVARGRARRRDRRARDADQPDPARLVPHRLGRRSHDRVPRLAARRRRLVRVDVVPRSAPPVGSARVGAAPLQLARPRPPARPSRHRTRRSSACSRRSPRTGSRSGTASGSTPKAARHVPPAERRAHDNIREINAMTHIMNELIDEACGRVLAPRRGARLGRRHRRVLHDRSRRAAGRLRARSSRARSTPTR